MWHSSPPTCNEAVDIDGKQELIILWQTVARGSRSGSPGTRQCVEKQFLPREREIVNLPSAENPKAVHSLTQWGGRAGQEPVGH